MNGFRLLSLTLALCASAPAPAEPGSGPAPCCRAVNLNRMPTLDEIKPTLLDRQVIFIGESHDRYEQHLAQLEIIRRVHQAHPDLAIAMEIFPQTAQGDLDDYIAGRIDEAAMLRRTDYFQSNLDYRLYRPILHFAHDQGSPLVALNLPVEISRMLARGGLAALADP